MPDEAPGAGQGGSSEGGAVPPWRRRWRLLKANLRTEGRARASDAVADLLEALLGPAVGERLPPARLRRGVARSSSREEYLKAGALAAAELLGFLLRSGRNPAPGGRWLDFGCGSGRLARILLRARACGSLVGVDVDRPAIDWCRRYLEGGRFETIAPKPPMPLDRASFDLVFAASVFTHFDENAQLAWLEELARVLVPGGLLIASTHAPELVRLRPEITAAGRRQLAERGFLFEPGGGAFNDAAAFHDRAYLEKTWVRWFQPVAFEPGALFALQDLSLWERRE